mmetsp:Transcript_97190/g.274923  ORF Transcript_97190/g.274923 Transcript_97190/m.274923 type:complete len:218 (-) Transcript_97190:10-663(-)
MPPLAQELVRVFEEGPHIRRVLPGEELGHPAGPVVVQRGGQLLRLDRHPREVPHQVVVAQRIQHALHHLHHLVGVCLLAAGAAGAADAAHAIAAAMPSEDPAEGMVLPGRHHSRRVLARYVLQSEAHRHDVAHDAANLVVRQSLVDESCPSTVKASGVDLGVALNKGQPIESAEGTVTGSRTDQPQACRQSKASQARPMRRARIHYAQCIIEGLGVK